MAMARKRASTPASKLVTPDRAARLYRLLQLLGRGSRSRGVLLRRLRLNVRGFYRDLETLQKLGIPVTLESRGYTLAQDLKDALARLPFPDPGLTFAEAEQLARGRTAAHRKLKQLIAQMTR
jgi:predicted DNA-binding transcriptional regulator YafY